MDREIFHFSISSTALTLNVIVVAFVATVFVFLLLKMRGKVRVFSSSIVGVVLTLFLFLFIVFPLTNTVVLEGLFVKLNVLPFTVKELSLSSINPIGTVNWEIDSQYRPTAKLNGAGVGSYKVGWYKLKNGSKALVMTNSPEVFLFESQGVYYLLAPDRLDEFASSVSKHLQASEK